MLTRLAIAILLASSASIVAAQSLGIQGALYNIDEEDAVGYIKRRLTEWEKDGTIKRKQEESIRNVRNTVFNPKPIPGISNATETRVHYFDPTVVLDKPITDAKGRVIFPTGTRVNPLEHGGLSKRYVFVDARVPAQVEFALEGKKLNPTDKIVLTGGSWVELSKKAGSQVYYDQSGSLTRRFRITHVPAIVQQDGLKLKIEERAL